MKYLQAVEGCQPNLRRTVDRWAARAAHLLAPTVCILCRGAGQPDIDLCSACERDLPYIANACVRCATPLIGAAADSLCGRCLRRAPAFHAACAPYRYDYPINWLIHGLKFRREAACGRVLGQLLARRLSMRPPTTLPEVIIPIPLAPARYRERGFNQATELALPLRAALGVHIRADLAHRSRDTREQAGLKRKQRRRNVRDAFALTGVLPAQRVAILDDVVTTGSTVNELAKVLRRAGARVIEVWAIARTSRV